MCCAFSARERFLMLGTCTGQLKLYNVFTGQEEASYNCHTSAITHLEPSRVSRSCILIPKLCNSKIRFSFSSIEEMQQISLYNKLEEKMLKKYLRKLVVYFLQLCFFQSACYIGFQNPLKIQTCLVNILEHHFFVFQDGTLLLTSASWSYPLSALWGMESVFITK